MASSGDYHAMFHENPFIDLKYIIRGAERRQKVD
jgi:hypothetical protein